MVLRYPLFLIIGIPVVVLLMAALHFFRQKRSFKGGIKAANTKIVKELPEYKKIKIFQVAITIVMEVALCVSLISSLYLMARPSKIETLNNGVKKRDIFLCMDVSYSIYELNLELVDNLEDVVRGLDGDRFGVSIYNTSTVLYVPMTDDYDFVIQKLEEIKEYFVLQEEYMSDFGDYEYLHEIPEQKIDRYYELREKLDYYDAGTLVNNMAKGSSLIGEGLASCLYSFPHIEDAERTRIIIMSTDNDQQERGRPLLELPEAADMCKKNGVVIFGLFPNKEVFTNSTTIGDYDTEKSQFKTAVEKTGGKFYEQSATLTVSDIVKDIQAQEAMEVDEIVIRKSIDQPKIPFIILFISLTVFFIMGVILVI